TLAQNLGIILSREKLLDVVWGFDYYGETRTVDVHINHLREKIAGSGARIETVRGAGYKLVQETRKNRLREKPSPPAENFPDEGQ
ncbi:MAG: winged helix-turn-helix domain-containing protein, partial [Chloroflexota bacterium]|nr:winged helix-turn-helix domain-containing protein [Chloroflexota bacterium]